MVFLLLLAPIGFAPWGRQFVGLGIGALGIDDRALVLRLHLDDFQ